MSVTTESLREFREWRRDKENAAAYAELETIWEDAHGLRDDPDIQALTRQAVARPSGTRPGKPTFGALGLAGLGGAAVCFALFGVWWTFQDHQTFKTRVGEQRTIELADGSRVQLNTDSEVSVRFTRRERRVVLSRGEAFFDVRHDSTRPFSVAAGGSRVIDVGTKFDVRRTNSELRVTLVQGEVRVADSDGHTASMDSPGQQAVIGGKRVSIDRSARLLDPIGWTKGRVIFSSIPLSAAVDEVNRYSSRKIVLDPDLKSGGELLSGAFNIGDVAGFASGVQEVFSLEAKTDASGNIHLSRRLTALR